MKHLRKYEDLIEDFSIKSYKYVGDVIKIDIDEKRLLPIFVMESPELEGKLNLSQKNELNGILEKAMEEVLKYKTADESVKKYLGWDINNAK